MSANPKPLRSQWPQILFFLWLFLMLVGFVIGNPVILAAFLVVGGMCIPWLICWLIDKVRGQ